METFFALLTLCEGNPLVSGGFHIVYYHIVYYHWSAVASTHKGQWHRALMFCLICAWTNSWANNRDTGDLRCHHAHYDVTVMQDIMCHSLCFTYDITVSHTVHCGSTCINVIHCDIRSWLCKKLPQSISCLRNFFLCGNAIYPYGKDQTCYRNWNHSY